MRLGVMQRFHGMDFRLESSEHNNLVACAREMLSMTNQIGDAVECNANSENVAKDTQWLLCRIKRNLDESCHKERL